MSSQQKTAIVTGASQGIGAGVVKAFVERGFNVVATSRKVTRSTEIAASDRVALVDGVGPGYRSQAKVVDFEAMLKELRAEVRLKAIDAIVTPGNSPRPAANNKVTIG